MSKKPKKYTVYFTKTVEKIYKSIHDIKLKRGINRIIEELEENPYKFKKLSGPLAHLRSAKTFSFRVVFEINEKEVIVIVIGIDNRKNAYR